MNNHNEHKHGRYVYCVAESVETINLGAIGLDGNEVYSVLADGLCAVVHDCSAEAYASEDEQTLHRWVINHQDVVKAASERFGTVLPMRFDTIVQDTEKGSVNDNIRRWLTEDGGSLRSRLDRIRGKEEYGVQISWDPKRIAETVSSTDPEIKQVEEEIRGKSKGLSYMYRLRQDKLLKSAMEKEAEDRFKDFYHRIEGCVDEIKVERTKTGEERPMLANLSCLVLREQSAYLAKELEKINSMSGFFVRFTGPWPPYSFVGVE
ncbi:MAG: GvpL/GvpF family gas vesicle protein [Ignavibacteriales bacterium]|nr:GvpL/GvpF family gas vesicle protein [Ignavibacteriales bacterium]